VVGTAAMFLVGGSILIHGMPGSHEFVGAATHAAAALPAIGGMLAALTPLLIDALTGVVAGGLVVGVVTATRRLFG
jgi:hypothetical protein